MKSNEQTDQLLRCLMHILGRAAVPPEKVVELIGGGKRQVTAFNLCDGTLSQSEVAKKAGIDRGNFSRTFSRWVENGIAFTVGDGNDAKLLHIYPIPSSGEKKRKGKR
jgi:hypothetical protein